MKIIIGLGNPGLKYKKTRHNVGFMVLDFLANGQKWQKSKKAKALYLWTKIAGEETELVKPQTFMNNSGLTVAYIKKKHAQLELTDFIIIHDDIDLPLGEIRIAQGSSSAGHKGVASLIEALGSKNFIRIRLGIGRDENLPTDIFVLKKFKREELRKIQEKFPYIEQIIKTIISEGIDKAKSELNKSK